MRTNWSEQTQEMIMDMIMTMIIKIRDEVNKKSN